MSPRPLTTAQRPQLIKHPLVSPPLQARDRSSAYPWDAVGGVPQRDTRPGAHLHHQDATVGQDSYNPRFDTPGVQPGYRRQGEEGGWGRGSVPGSNRLQLSDRDRQEAAARVAALKEQLNEVGGQGGKVCGWVGVGGGGVNRYLRAGVGSSNWQDSRQHCFCVDLHTPCLGAAHQCLPLSVACVLPNHRLQAEPYCLASPTPLSQGAGLPSAPPLPAKEPGWLNTDARQHQQQRGYPSAAAAAPYGTSDDWGSSSRDQYRGGSSKYSSSKEEEEDKEIQLLRRQAADAREAWQDALKNMEQATAQRQEEEQRRAREKQRRDKTPNWQKVMAGLFSAGVPVYNQPDL